MVEYVDVVCDLVYGDCGKGVVASQLAKTGNYNLVARWAGGNNAGHTVYVNGKKYKTHLVPSGVFFGIQSLVGPGCVLHPESFQKELNYLTENGFDSSLVKVHPSCHIVLPEHIELDKQNLAAKLGTTSKGIAYAYASKAARTGVLAQSVLDEKLLWRDKLAGIILCEGAQGAWLDQDHGYYPYVTSSTTLPYGACSIGFPPQKIKNIYGCAKAYDTRSGEDPIFPNSLLNDPLLTKLGELGEEIGVTTGRRRKVNWLNLDRLITAINLTGSTEVIIRKCDILDQLGVYRLFKMGLMYDFKTFNQMEMFLRSHVLASCPLVKDIRCTYSPETL